MPPKYQHRFSPTNTTKVLQNRFFTHCVLKVTDIIYGVGTLTIILIHPVGYCEAGPPIKYRLPFPKTSKLQNINGKLMAL